MAITNQRLKKLEKTILDRNTEVVPLLALVNAKTEEELQKWLKILQNKPLHLRERPLDYEKYFKE
jgi:hypothetical protein